MIVTHSTGAQGLQVHYIAFYFYTTKILIPGWPVSSGERLGVLEDI